MSGYYIHNLSDVANPLLSDAAAKNILHQILKGQKYQRFELGDDPYASSNLE